MAGSKGGVRLEKYRVSGKGGFRLARFDPGEKDGFSKKKAVDILATEQEKLAELQNLLYADGRHSLLIVLQAMDTGGKDGTIRKVFGPINPQGVRVYSFKQPNPKELSHDFLWRVHACAPKKGMIHVFNRSHYEDVLIARVHKLASEKVIAARYRHINDFEHLLYESGTHIIKFFLHISKDEQKKRLQDRLDDPTKHWKFSSADLKERQYWEDYQRAYELMLKNCSTPCAPWYVIPAECKWRRNILVARIVGQHLEGLKCRYPAPEPGLDKIVIE